MMIKCDNAKCKKQIPLTTANTVLFLYEQQVWFSWIMATCECSEEHRIFIEPDAVRQIITESICGIVHEQFAPDEIVANYEATFKVSMPKFYQLLPRHEDEVTHFAEVLANCPDDLLMDCLTEPPPKSTMPLRWTN